MARVYATETDYKAYAATETPPANIGALLAQASRFLDANLFRLCWFVADPDSGMPTDSIVSQAFTDATCAQAQWWDELGDSIGALGAGFGNVAIGSVQLGRSVTATGPENSPARQIAPQVIDVLTAPDLTPHRLRVGEVRTWGWVGEFW
ncbi:hypothetical protein ACWENS_05610 [Streptomyces sp. NPDC004532]